MVINHPKAKAKSKGNKSLYNWMDGKVKRGRKEGKEGKIEKHALVSDKPSLPPHVKDRIKTNPKNLIIFSFQFHLGEIKPF